MGCLAYSGEAIAVAGMTVEQMSEYWANYQAHIGRIRINGT